MSAIEEAIAFIECGLDDAERHAGTYADDPHNWHARHKAAMAVLAARIEETLGGRITDRWDAARIRLLGITSTSTTGIAGALRNWMTAARRKAGL